MESIRRLFGLSTGQDVAAEDQQNDDLVYPMHMLDDTNTLRQIVVTWTWQFNDVLSPDKMHQSLSRLLEIGDWKKLGGRLRLKENGELEIRVPKHFSAERPAISYSHNHTGMALAEHPLAKTLPKGTDGPSIHPGPDTFRAFACRDDAPVTLQDFLTGDVPQISLHITSFTDATLVALSWPHTLMDVMGQQALVRAWSLVAAGREAEVPALLGAHTDVLRAAVDADDSPREEFELESQRLTGWKMALFGLNFMWDLLWNSNVDTRTIFLPGQTLARLRKQVEQDLVESSNAAGKPVPFVSDGDILTAWMTNAMASALPQPRPVTVLQAANCRARIPSLSQTSGLYVQNMALGAFVSLSASTATGPLGEIAQVNRRHLAQQCTEGQMAAFLRQLYALPHLQSDPSIVCGDVNAVLMPFTNWSQAKFFDEINFASVVSRPRDAADVSTNPPGTIVYHHSSSRKQSPTVRNVVVILGKDHGGGYWMTGMLLPGAWVKIEERIKELGDLPVSD